MVNMSAIDYLLGGANNSAPTNLALTLPKSFIFAPSKINLCPSKIQFAPSRGVQCPPGPLL